VAWATAAGSDGGAHPPQMDRIGRIGEQLHDRHHRRCCAGDARAAAISFSWEGLQRDSIHGLSKAFLVVRGYHGWIGCGYLSVETASRLGDAAAVFSGVSTHDDLLGARAVAVSTAGATLGLEVGMAGRDALDLLRGESAYPLPPSVPVGPPQGFDWSGLTCEHIPLRWPLLVVRGSRGFLACSYVSSPGGTDKTGDAAACMTPCLTHAEFLEATIKEGSVSQLGMELGLREGMNGAAALQLIR
jgi:uncharacterized protein YunC (DUF1805 family)